MPLVNGWKVDKSSPDTERFHLNKVLAAIRAYIDALVLGGQVDSVVGGTGVDVDATDPVNPEVSLDAGTLVSLGLADTAVQPGDLAAVAATGDYADLINQPSIPPQFNPIAGDNVTITGTYPNITFASTSAGGVLPVVTGEISSGQPVFVIAEDSSLIYLPVEA